MEENGGIKPSNVGQTSNSRETKREMVITIHINSVLGNLNHFSMADLHSHEATEDHRYHSYCVAGMEMTVMPPLVGYSKISWFDLSMLNPLKSPRWVVKSC